MAADTMTDEKNGACELQPATSQENGQHGATPELVPSGPVSLAGAEESSEEQTSVEGPKRKGRCKWFNVAKGWGFISAEDGGQDVFVHQSVIKMCGFRSLGDEEEVEFECKTSGKGLEATSVTGPQGADCLGSHRRPTSKKRFRKIRCYNCGEFSNHIAAKCTMGPQPKRCHSCKSSDHLVADCPSRSKKDPTGNNSSNNDNNHSNNESPSPAAEAQATE